MQIQSPSRTFREPRREFTREADRSTTDRYFFAASIICIVYSFILAASIPLPLIPPVAYVPIFLLVLGCIVLNNRTFILAWILAASLPSVGGGGIEVIGGEFVTRDLVYSFGSFRLGFLNIGIGNTSLVLSGLFVVRNYIHNLEQAIRIFAIPIMLLIFSALQYLIHPGYLQMTISNRSIVICLFVSLAIANLSYTRAELDKVTRWLLYLLCLLPLLYLLRFFEASGGRSMFVLAMASLPLTVYLYKTKKVISFLLMVAILVVVGDILVFRTYWFKLIIITSVAAVIILPFIQRHRFVFWIFPAFSMFLPLTSVFIEPSEELRMIQRETVAQRETSGIGDLTDFNMFEVWDLVMFKYQTERASLWQSSLRHTFYPISINTVLPDPSSHFYWHSGSIIGLWMYGPHHGFLWLLRVYGLVFGLLIFGFINWLIYKCIIPQWHDGPMRWVFQPFLLSFAVIGFNIGDYPLDSSGSYLVFLLLGLALAHNRWRIFRPVEDSVIKPIHR